MSMDDNNNLDQSPYEEYPDPFREDLSEEGNRKKSPNRTFITVLGVIGSIFVLAIIVLIAFVLISRSRTAARFQEQAAQINAENTAIAQAASETAVAAIQRMTEKAMPPTWTPTTVIARPTNTPVPTKTATVAGIADSAERTATVAAFLTQVAQNTTAPRTTATTRATSTALPSTGFVEDVGLPGLFGLALALVVIIFLARRLRASTS
jgi:cytoskeletal protein RodZ